MGIATERKQMKAHGGVIGQSNWKRFSGMAAHAPVAEKLSWSF
jgi:hypothetical protein